MPVFITLPPFLALIDPHSIHVSVMAQARLFPLHLSEWFIQLTKFPLTDGLGQGLKKSELAGMWTPLTVPQDVTASNK